MLGIFKRFLSRPEDGIVATTPPPAKVLPPGATREISRPVQPLPRPVPRVPAARPVMPPSQGSAHPSPGCVQVTLAAIESSVPESLRHKIVGALSEVISIPAEKIIPQLSYGTITLTLGELRECAPELLASLTGHDEIAVTLPLANILKQLDASMFTRRVAQRKLEVPEDIASVFQPTGSGLSINHQPVPAPTAAASPVQPRPPAARPATAAASVTPAQPAPAAPVPAAPRIALSPEAVASLNAAQPAPRPAAAPAPIAPAVPTPTRPAPSPLPARPSSPAAAVPRPAAPASSVMAGAKLSIPVHKLTDVWPDEIRRELDDVEVNTAEFLIPMELIEPALKSGKVLFSWGDLAGWLQPPLPRTPSRAASDILVDLPLKILAPLFMAQHRAATSPAKAQVDQTIPDLFYSSTGPANPDARVTAPNLPPPTALSATAVPAPAGPAPVPSPIPGPAPITMPRVTPLPSAAVATPAPATPTVPRIPASAPAPAAETVETEGLTLEQLVGPEQHRHSPKEVLNNVTRIPGITGAILAMNDGLLVTASVPANVKAETLAAFLPQIFGRMGQYTRELGLGAMQNMALGVEGGSWQIFKQQSIYFAVCGQAGESMPFNLLAQVAAELGKQQM